MSEGGKYYLENIPRKRCRSTGMGVVCYLSCNVYMTPLIMYMKILWCPNTGNYFVCFIHSIAFCKS